jgi:hypothetical protein
MPFTYFSSGLSLQNNGAPVTGVSTLNFVNGELGVAGNVASFTAPALVLTQDGVTVTSPTFVTLAGTAELTQNATSPSIVQISPVGNTTQSGNFTIEFDQAPKVGNLIVLFTWGQGAVHNNNNNSGQPISTIYETAFFSSAGPGNTNCFYKTSAGASDTSVTVLNTYVISALLIEIENQGQISTGGNNNQVNITEGTFDFNSFDAAPASIIFTFFSSSSAGQSVYSAPEPAGSEITVSYIDPDNLQGLLIFSPGNGETAVGITSSAAFSGVYGQISIAPNAANISATITT